MRIYCAFGILALAGCVTETEVSGAQSFAENCAACHGANGMGGGAAGSALSTQPPDLTMLSARNGGVFPRDYVMSTIDGFSRGSHFSPEMPAFGDGDLGDVVIVEVQEGIGTPIPVELLALADYLQTLQK